MPVNFTPLTPSAPSAPSTPTPTTPAPVQEAAPVASQSTNIQDVIALVSGVDANMAAALQANPVQDLPALADRPSGAYLTTAHPMSNNWEACRQAGVAEGEYYLDGSPAGIIHLPTVRYWIYAVAVFATEMDESGDILAATFRPEVLQDLQAIRAAGMQEHFVTVALIDTPQHGVIPCKAEFRGTKSNGGKIAVEALRSAVRPEWSRQSDNHRIASQFPFPFGRVYTTATTVATVVKGGPRKGKSCHVTRAMAGPTPLEALERLAKCLSSAEGVLGLNAAVTGYNTRIKQIIDVCR